MTANRERPDENPRHNVMKGTATSSPIRDRAIRVLSSWVRRDCHECPPLARLQKMLQGRGGEQQVLKSTFPAGLGGCSSSQRTCQSVKRLVLTIKDEASDWLSVCDVDLHGIATNTAGVANLVRRLLCHLPPSACTEPVR